MSTFIRPPQYTEAPIETRSGFYLHGSQGTNDFGSIGCIDLGTNSACRQVLQTLRIYGKKYGSYNGGFKVDVSVSKDVECDN